MYPMSFQPLSFSQASPYVTGMEAGTNIAGQNMLNQVNAARAQQLNITNQYLPQQSKANLLATQIANSMNQTRSQYLPQALQAGLAAQDLANQATGITNQYLPQTLSSQIGLQGAQAGALSSEAAKNRFMLQNPEFMSEGIGGQIGQLGYLQQTQPGLFGGGAPASQPQAPQQSPIANQNVQMDANGIPTSPLPGLGGGLASALTNAMSQQPGQMPQAQQGSAGGMSDLQNRIMQSMFLPMQKDMAQMNWYNTRSSPYANLTPDAKNYELGQGNAFGYTPDQTTQALMSGKTIADLAQAKGYGADPSTWPTPLYAPTTAQRSLIVNRNASMAELQQLDTAMRDPLGDYAQRIDGYSPSQVMDAISNKDPDTQAKFIAAKSLLPEISALRVKTMNGQVGIEAIREVQQQSMNNFKAFQPLLTPEVYKKANDYINQSLEKAVEAASKVGGGIYQQNSTSGSMMGGSVGGVSSNTADPLGIR